MDLKTRQKILAFLAIFFVVIVSVQNVFSEEQNYVLYKHKALFLEIKYPKTWNNYWSYDDYAYTDIRDMSMNEISRMVAKYTAYPCFYIKKHKEIYYGINPSIRISLLPIRFQSQLNQHRDYLMELNFGEISEDEKLSLMALSDYSIYTSIIEYTKVTIKSLVKGKTILVDLVAKTLNHRDVLYVKTTNYVLNPNENDTENDNQNDNEYDDDFNAITEYYFCIEDNYFINIEVNYSKNISNEDKNELMEILKTIKF
jgi:hypothetical protein